MEDVKEINQKELDTVSGGHEEDCCTHYVCPICGEELVLVRFLWFHEALL